jgi:4-hydroxy-3-methylbut-2-enyl diphosphate reductase
MRILLANPRGFCAGVDRAIDIVERAVELFGAPIYVRHEVVHNRFVVDRLRNLGAVFVEELDEVPDAATVIFSAHGVSKAVQDQARHRGLQVFDATCPLVTKVHMEVARYARDGLDVILIGHEGHPEVEGTMGQFDEQQGGRISLVEDVADVLHSTCAILASGVVTQTTLSVDDTRGSRRAEARFRRWHAAQKTSVTRRRTARRGEKARGALRCRGGRRLQTSSNSNRLREIAAKAGIPGYLVDGPDDLRREWFVAGRRRRHRWRVRAGAAGAAGRARLREWGGEGAQSSAAGERRFALPRELRSIGGPDRASARSAIPASRWSRDWRRLRPSSALATSAQPRHVDRPLGRAGHTGRVADHEPVSAPRHGKAVRTAFAGDGEFQRQRHSARGA